MDDWLREMRTPPAPAEAPPWPETRRWSRIAVFAVAACVIVAAGVGMLRVDERPRARGVEAAAVVLDLRLVVDRGGVAVRVSQEGICRVGERVFFRLSSDVSASATVWVDGPAGREVIGEIEAGPVARDLGDAAGLVAYRFDAPGRYVFRASARGTRPCARCPEIAVVVP